MSWRIGLPTASWSALRFALSARPRKYSACRCRHVSPVRRLVEPLERVLADRVEHAEAAAAPPPDEVLLDERLEDVELGVADRLGRLEREAAARTRPGAGRAPARPARAARSSTRSPRATCAAAPGASRGSRWRGAAAAGRAGRAARPGSSSATRAAASSIASGSPSSRRQISPTSRSGGSRARPPARARRRATSASSSGKRLDRVALLGLEVQRLAARDEHLRVGRAGEQRGDRRRGLDDLLEVVEKDEQRACSRRGRSGRRPRRPTLPDRALDECGVAERLERHPEDAVGEVLDRLGRELEREPRLAAPAGPGQRRAAGACEASAPASSSSRSRPTSGVGWIGRFVR